VIQGRSVPQARIPLSIIDGAETRTCRLAVGLLLFGRSA
jgi:hypothetical protein